MLVFYQVLMLGVHKLSYNYYVADIMLAGHLINNKRPNLGSSIINILQSANIN